MLKTSTALRLIPKLEKQFINGKNDLLIQHKCIELLNVNYFSLSFTFPKSW